jgi:hypothetical protein
MHVSSRTSQQNSIHSVEKCIDVGDAWTTGKHQREGVRDVADTPKIVFPNVLDVQDVMDRIGATDNADYWLAHFRPVSASATVHKAMWDLMDVDMRPADGCASAGFCRKRIPGRYDSYLTGQPSSRVTSSLHSGCCGLHNRLCHHLGSVA